MPQYFIFNMCMRLRFNKSSVWSDLLACNLNQERRYTNQIVHIYIYLKFWLIMQLFTILGCNLVKKIKAPTNIHNWLIYYDSLFQGGKFEE